MYVGLLDIGQVQTLFSARSTNFNPEHGKYSGKRRVLSKESLIDSRSDSVTAHDISFSHSLAAVTHHSALPDMEWVPRLRTPSPQTTGFSLGTPAAVLAA